MTSRAETALASKAWPFLEAQKILDRLKGTVPEKGYVLFETGYGPSGLPHIGTFAEVARTTMVRKAFEILSDIPTKLLAFSDDMDGLRKVPDNVPNKDLLAANLEKPLTQVPDPFGTHDSFGHHNNARLRAFLDQYGFVYEFASSTDYYTSGRFDAALLAVLANYDKIMGVMLPTLREERRRTYSPFLPVSPASGKVLQVPLLATDAAAGTVTYRDEGGEEVTQPVTGGQCKLQWKVDWAMRWHALGVDYEMSGKDLIDSVKHSSAICRILGSRPPESYSYEMFLDEEGRKISKSVGNGLTMEEWLRYGTPESLSFYMYQSPRKAKRLYFDVIPKATDDYYTFLNKYREQDEQQRFANPVWHIHHDTVPEIDLPVSFALLLNLVAASNSEDKQVLWGFISRHFPGVAPENHPELDHLVGYAVAYYHDFVRPAKKYRTASAEEAAAMTALRNELQQLPADSSADDLQNLVYEIGKTHGFSQLRDWFKALYEVLLGQSQGPRMGSFIQLYGIAETIALIDRALAGELAAA